MDSTEALKRLRAQRRAVLARLAKCRREIDECEKDLLALDQDEEQLLNAAPSGSFSLRSSNRFGGARSADANDSKKLSGVGADQAASEYRPIRGKGTPFPSNVHSIAWMVRKVLMKQRERFELREAKFPGLTGREILKEINDTWWPGVSQNSILPKLYKYERDRHLIERVANRWEIRITDIWRWDVPPDDED